MKLQRIGKIADCQDGAIYGGFLFCMNEKGQCRVFRVRDCSFVASFTLDRVQQLMPHCNSVMFGSYRYCGSDEFPLLYCNVYNNYAGAPDAYKATTCVYRVQRDGDAFSATLVQLIRVGFTEDPLWRSAGGDVRPYGNCVIDRDNGHYYAFTMRDGDPATRFFAFRLPKPEEGTPDEKLGISCVVLQKEDIRAQFDCPYQHYIQGATFEKGVIYSLEGFSSSHQCPPAIRLIDVSRQEQLQLLCFEDYGLDTEPELIDFEDGICYYADAHGNFYNLTF